VAAIEGTTFPGRWGAGTFPVIYLARPEESVLIEAYRHLVDPTPGLEPHMVRPRKLWRVTVDVDEVLDLTMPGAVALIGIAPQSLHSPISDYATCQEVAAAAHRLGLKGVLAAAAEGDGVTLAIFPRCLGPDDRIESVVTNEAWGLASDPRLMGSFRATGDGGAAR
jgi:RES domain-containing protein